MPDFEVVLIDGLSAKFGPHVSNPVASLAFADFFLPGDQGVALDMTSAGVMFQDYSGAVPVSAANQPVSLVLDESAGMVLGPENTTNGDFDTTSGWSLFGPVISGGKLIYSSVSSGTGATNAPAQSIVQNALYKITLDVESVTEGALLVKIGNGYYSTPNGPGNAITTGGLYEFYAIGGGIDFFGVSIDTANTTTAVVRSVSVKRVAGNHASITTPSLRPQYKTDGTLHWLEGDGVDDDLIVTLPASMVGPTVTIGFAVKGLGGVVMQDTLTDPVMHLGPMLNYGPGFGVAAYFIIDRALSTDETAALQALLNARAGL